MASKLKNRRQKSVSSSENASEVEKPIGITERRPSSSHDGDELSASNIASKIHARRLPKRTPTTHVKTINAVGDPTESESKKFARRTSHLLRKTTTSIQEDDEEQRDKNPTQPTQNTEGSFRS